MYFTRVINHLTKIVWRESERCGICSILLISVPAFLSSPLADKLEKWEPVKRMLGPDASITISGTTAIIIAVIAGLGWIVWGLAKATLIKSINYLAKFV